MSKKNPLRTFRKDAEARHERIVNSWPKYGVGGRVLNEKNVDTVALQSDINQKLGDLRKYESNMTFLNRMRSNTNKEGQLKSKKEKRKDKGYWNQTIKDPEQSRRMWEESYLNKIKSIAKSPKERAKLKRK